MKYALTLCLAAWALASAALAQAPMSDATGHSYTVGVTSWRDMPFRRVVRQQFDYSCGSAAVATLLTYHYGKPTSETDAFKAMFAIGDQEKIRKQGFSMLDMKSYLAARGLTADGYKVPLSALAKDEMPAIALIQNGPYKHFVVVKGIRNGVVVIGDPALGDRALSVPEFTKVWNGIVLAVHPEAGKGVFNHKADWEVRPGAPWNTGIDRLPVAELTSNFAPLYQIAPLRDISTVAP